VLIAVLLGSGDDMRFLTAVTTDDRRGSFWKYFGRRSREVERVKTQYALSSSPTEDRI